MASCGLSQAQKWIRPGALGAQIGLEWIPWSANRRRVDSPIVHSSRFCAPSRPLEPLLRSGPSPNRPLEALLRSGPSPNRPLEPLLRSGPPCQSSTRATFALRPPLPIVLSRHFCALDPGPIYVSALRFHRSFEAVLCHRGGRGLSCSPIASNSIKSELEIELEIGRYHQGAAESWRKKPGQAPLP